MMETMTAEKSVDLIITQLIAASYRLLDVDRISLFMVEKGKYGRQSMYVQANCADSLQHVRLLVCVICYAYI